MEYHGNISDVWNKGPLIKYVYTYGGGDDAYCLYVLKKCYMGAGQAKISNKMLLNSI